MNERNAELDKFHKMVS